MDDAVELPERRRARVWAIAGTAVVAGGIAVAVWPGSTACTGAAEQLAPVWNEAGRDAAERAILASGPGYAHGVWDRVRPRLESYAEDWVAHYTDACEATNVRKEQSEGVMDLRVRCLHQARRELDATAELLAEADEAVVERAYQIIERLPDLEHCDDVVALSTTVPPPEPRQADAVAELRDELARANARRGAGKYDEAVQLCDDLETRAEAVGYAPFLTEIALAAGFAHDGRADYERAEAALHDAVRGGLRWEQWTEAFDALSFLVAITGHRQHRYDAALAHAVAAQGLLDKLGRPDAQVATLHDNLGSIHHAKGDYASAKAEIEQAVELFTRAYGEDHGSTIQALDDLGATLHVMGRSDQAVPILRRVARARTKAYGRHPWVALARNNLGGALSGLGRFDEARVELEAAIELLRDTLGPLHPSLASSHNTLGTNYEGEGDYAEAEVQYRTALAIFERTTGVDDPLALVSRSNVGAALAGQGKHDEAATVLVDTLARQEANRGPHHPETVRTRHVLAEALVELRRNEAALALLERQRESLVEHDDVEERAAEAAFWLAKVLARLDREPDRVAQLAAEAQERYAKLGHLEAGARVRTWLAQER